MAIITIWRPTVSGGEAVVNCLSRRYHLPCISREVLAKAAARIGVGEDKLRLKLSQTPRWWPPHLSEDHRLYLFALQSALADACLGGELVYHGRLGHLLPANLPAVLRVRLIAPAEARIRELEEHAHMDWKAASKLVCREDEEGERWTQFLYGADWNDSTTFDLVFNLRDLSAEEACSAIGKTASLPRFVVTSAFRKAYADFALSCRVKLALVADKRTRHLKLGIRANNGRVAIFAELASGGIPFGVSNSLAERVRLIAAGVQGVGEVRVDLRRYPRYADV